MKGIHAYQTSSLGKALLNPVASTNLEDPFHYGRLSITLIRLIKNGAYVSVRELVFPETAALGSWLPKTATEYQEWEEGGQSGSFTDRGESYVFFLLNSIESYRHYVVGTLPEEHFSVVAPSKEVAKSIKDIVTGRDRRDVHINEDNVTTGFFYGVRFCKPCIVCGKELATVNNTDDHIADQPSGGTNFSSSGHYGSGVFDPMSRETLSINICDECLTSKGRAGAVTHIAERKRIVDESIRVDWSPYGENTE